MKHVCVVGGGIAGLLAAILLAKKNYHVSLIETEHQCGGLLRSVHEDEADFDFGTHIPEETGVAQLDKVLFGEVEEASWNVTDRIKSGNFFSGRLYPYSQFIYAPHCSAAIYQQGLSEALACEPSAQSASQLRERLYATFGPTFTEHLFKPLLYKFQRQDLSDLHPSAYLLFGLSRLIVGDGFMSRELKKSTVYDEKFAFSTFNEGVSALRKFYPRQGGIGVWTQNLVNKAVGAGVNVLTGTGIEAVAFAEKKLMSVTTDSHGVLPVDYLVWSAPPMQLIHLLKLPGKFERPLFRSMTIHHFKFDRPFLCDNMFIYCHDAELNTFRVTLYSNLRDAKQSPPYTCTVEALTDAATDLSALNERIIKELVQMTVVSPEAQLLYNSYKEIHNGFPVMTNSFFSNMVAQRELLERNVKNLLLIGKASGKAFFMQEVLKETYNLITDFDL